MSHNQLDLSSDSFNALESIYGENDVPDPSAPVLDNVDAFISQLEGRANASSGGKSKADQKKNETSAKPTTSSRRFTAEQMPVQGNRRTPKNLLTFMEKQTDGPLSALQNCVQNRTKIKVSTRKLNGIRGTCVGFLVAYDKHWNLAMIDVDETFNRPRYRKPEVHMNDNNSSSRTSTEKVGESIVRVIKTRRNTEMCQRHVPQIVLRGEQVALVQILT